MGTAVIIPNVQAVYNSGTPPTITGLRAWYDWSDAASLFTDTGRTTPVASDGDSIAGVTDKSGTGNHLEQSTAGARPTYKVNQLNGRSAAALDGGDFWAEGSHVLTYSQPNTIVIVGKHGDGVAAKHFFDGSITGRNLVGVTAGPVWALYGGAVLSGSATNTNNNIFAGIFNSTSSKLYVNGGSANASGNAGTLTLGESLSSANFYVGCGVGGAEFLPNTSRLYEMLIYNANVSLSDLNALGAYIQSKWGLTWTTAV